MNGNVKRVDHAADKDGKHSCFLILSHKTRETLKKDATALAVYLELLGQADSRFNATTENIAAEVRLTKKTVRAALERLQGEYCLLKVEQEKDVSKATLRKTRRGFIVPNTARIYYVYYEPFAEHLTEQAQERRELERTTAEAERAALQIVKQEEAPPAMAGQQLLQMRIQQVKEIAGKHGLLSNRQLERVLEQLRDYKKLRGRQADDNMIDYIAMQLSHNSGYNVNNDICLKV